MHMQEINGGQYHVDNFLTLRGMGTGSHFINK